MSFLLDTNIVSELTKPVPDPRCVAGMEAHQSDCSLSAVTLGELRYGLERLPEGKKRAALTRAFGFLCEDFAERFYPFDGPAAVEWGRYAAELEQAFGADWWRQFDYRDTQIAAIAREHGLQVVTRNEKHFPGVATVNPFT